MRDVWEIEKTVFIGVLKGQTCPYVFIVKLFFGRHSRVSVNASHSASGVRILAEEFSEMLFFNNCHNWFKIDYLNLLIILSREWL